MTTESEWVATFFPPKKHWNYLYMENIKYKNIYTTVLYRNIKLFHKTFWTFHHISSMESKGRNE